ncbi:MAG: thiolase family protein [Pseudomonadota bacterium]
MRETWIISGARTPIGSFQGSLTALSAPQLGAAAIREAVRRAGVEPGEVCEVLMGCVLPAGMGQAPARQATIFAGLPDKVPATMVHKVCGSGLKAVMLGAQAIATGDADIVVAGGMESMTNVPYSLPKGREGLRMGHGEIVDLMIKDGLWDVYNNYHMGTAGELCAKELKISREAQDAFAKESYERAQRAVQEGYFKEEIVPVEIAGRKGEKTVVSEDEEPGKVRFDKIAELKPVFDKNGTITAANASKLNDGAAALVLMAAEVAKAKGLKPMARIVGQAQAAREPAWFTIAPADAIEKLHKKLGWSKENVDLYEINEAFSVVSLAVNDRLKIDPKKINVHGGAVALGHPIGASGARILVTLLYAMKRYGKKRGVASLCIGGGEAVALGVES